MQRRKIVYVQATVARFVPCVAPGASYPTAGCSLPVDQGTLGAQDVKAEGKVQLRAPRWSSGRICTRAPPASGIVYCAVSPAGGATDREGY